MPNPLNKNSGSATAYIQLIKNIKLQITIVDITTITIVDITTKETFCDNKIHLNKE